jgi:phage tail-like protein
MPDVNEAIEKDVLDFFNQVKDPKEIVKRIHDDPGFGKRGYGVRLSLARRILAVRCSLPGGRFTSLEQIDAAPGVGSDTLHDFLYSFRTPGPEPVAPGKFLFRVEIEGIAQGQFLEVSGLESSTDVVLSADGNSALLRKTPGRTGYSNIILKRGFANTNELWNWRKKVVDGEIDRRRMSIIICDEADNEIMRYNALETWPCRWKSSALCATGKETIIEEIEVVVEKIERG